jgi:carboxylesterase type B
MMRCLRSKNPVDLVAAQYKLLEFAPFPQTLFSPVIEPLSPEAFITEKPDRLYATDHVPRKPWIFTTVAQEGYLGLLFVQSVVGEGSLRSRWEELAPIYLDYKYTARNVSATTKMLTKFYFGRMSPKNVPESKLAAIFGDRLMLPGINKALEVHSQHAPTYAAIFGFKGKYTLGRMVGRRASDWGVGHTDDLFYYFNSSTYVPGFKKADVAELAMSNIMTTFLANFAHTGEPLLPQEPSVFAGLWQPVQPHNVQFLQLNKEIKMIPQPFKKRLKFWRQVQEFDPLLLDPLLSL